MRDQLNLLAEEVAEAQNRATVFRWDDYRKDLLALQAEIASRPETASQRATIAAKAGLIANDFLLNGTIVRPWAPWEWVDVKVVREFEDGQQIAPSTTVVLEPDFKSFPALGFYTNAIATWITAIDLVSGGDGAVVRQKFGDDLRRHIHACGMRDGYGVDGTPPPETIAENIVQRVTGYAAPSSSYAERGQCEFGIVVDNAMRGTSSLVQDGITTLTPTGHLCQAPGTLGQPFVAAAADAEGVAVLAELGGKLERVLDNGSLREQFIGTFGWTPALQETRILALGQDGTVDWFHQSSSNDPDVVVPWDAPVRVGEGWDEYVQIVPAGGARLYGIRADAGLSWFEHTGYQSGEPTWSGPRELTPHWAPGDKVFGGGCGVIYSIDDAGDLWWHKHQREGDGVDAWAPSQRVGEGWQGLGPITSTGDGTIYAVRDDGRLIWFRHNGIDAGTFDWAGPTPQGEGWIDVKALIGAPGGILYATMADGEMRWFRHDDWEVGTPTWTGPVSFGHKFAGYRTIMAELPGTPGQIR